jgi:hypothetical protein
MLPSPAEVEAARRALKAINPWRSSIAGRFPYVAPVVWATQPMAPVVDIAYEIVKEANKFPKPPTHN